MVFGAGVGCAFTTQASAAEVASSNTTPVKFGLIADIQYADIDDASNFLGTSRRSYRGALEALHTAANEWKTEETNGLSFVMDLGDIIDQINETNGVSREALSSVLAAFTPLSVPHYHLVGNHELYNFTEKELNALLPGVARDGQYYHAFTPTPGWRMVVLNSYDIHCITDRETPPNAETAFRLLEKHNPNDVRSKRGTVNWSKGIEGDAMKFMPYNGGIGEVQKEWLRRELVASKTRGERAIVFTHVPVWHEASTKRTVLWNDEEILEILKEGNVALVFAGHDHRGGYAIKDGIHHVTIPSPLNTTKEMRTAHGIVELHEDAVIMHGSGGVPSYTFTFPKLDAVAHL